MTHFMRRFMLRGLVALSLGVTLPAFAGFYVGKTTSAATTPAVASQPALATTTGAAAITEYQVTLLPGSLKENLIRIAATQDWGNIVWKPSYDYIVTKPRTVMGTSLPGVLDKILVPYPLKAVIDPQNQEITIESK